MYTVRLGASVRKSACRREGNQAPFSVLAQWWHVTISIHRGPVEIQFNVKQPCDTFRTASSNEVMKITAINLIKKNEDSDCKSHMPSVELRSFKAHSKHRNVPPGLPCSPALAPSVSVLEISMRAPLSSGAHDKAMLHRCFGAQRGTLNCPHCRGCSKSTAVSPVRP